VNLTGAIPLAGNTMTSETSFVATVGESERDNRDEDFKEDDDDSGEVSFHR